MDSAEVALKYLDLARGEILEKVKFVNQTLGAYLLGTAAVGSWFYQSIHRTAAGQAMSDTVEKASAAIGLAFILSYLALGVNWIIHHNERMVTALAEYQRDELSKYLPNVPAMWERSIALHKGDDPGAARRTMAVEELIVLGPPFTATVFAFGQFFHAQGWPLYVWLPCAVVANLLNIEVGLEMFKSRLTFREEWSGYAPVLSRKRGWWLRLRSR